MENGAIKFILLESPGHAIVDRTVTDQEILGGHQFLSTGTGLMKNKRISCAWYLGRRPSCSSSVCAGSVDEAAGCKSSERAGGYYSDSRVLELHYLENRGAAFGILQNQAVAVCGSDRGDFCGGDLCDDPDAEDHPFPSGLSVGLYVDCRCAWKLLRPACPSVCGRFYLFLSD